VITRKKPALPEAEEFKTVEDKFTAFFSPKAGLGDR
jgi:hypothetical protein